MWAAATADDPPDGDLPAGVARIAEMRRAKREEARQQIADDDGIDPADVTDGDLQGADVLDTLVVATTHIEVDALNGALRDAARRGRPAPPDSDGVGVDWTDAHGTDHRWRYHVGDIVMTTDNDRTIRTTTRDTITNGRRWRITAISGDRLKLDSLDGQGAMELPAHYWKACDPKTGRPQLPHGYATTVYRSQGRTSDVALCLSGAGAHRPRTVCRHDAGPLGVHPRRTGHRSRRGRSRRRRARPVRPPRIRLRAAPARPTGRRRDTTTPRPLTGLLALVALVVLRQVRLEGVMCHTPGADRST